MFAPIEGGTLQKISNNNGYEYACWIPPLGFGINSSTGELEKTDVIKSSPNRLDQIWKRTDYPVDKKEWDKRRFKEKEKQKADPKYYDPFLLQFEQQEWKRRLCGVWIYIKGVPTYLTGTHYLYLNWWSFLGKFMDYRNPDKKFFYIWDYVAEDPNCLGLIEFTKRKQGKTARSGVILYEYISRTSNKHGGIQSKTSTDASEVFQKALIAAWKKLPDFFRPTYDTSQGDVPKSELRFFRPSQKGKKALAMQETESDELESWIDYKSSGTDAYDGPHLHRYVSDESGKLKDVSIVERHNTVMFCSEVDGDYIGKHLYTTTVEEMESGGSEFLTLVQNSDPNERNENGRTKTGLYTYFLPAYETMYYDKYGMPDTEKAKEFFLNTRRALQNEAKQLSSFIRKNPFTVQEAFRVDGEKCMFNSMKLNERRDYLSWNEDLVERGNFQWVEGKKDTVVEWVKSKNGRWEMPRGFSFDKKEDTNAVVRRGNICLPANKLRFTTAVDPYDHDSTEESRNSKAACLTLQRNNPFGGEEFNKAFVCKYCFRPSMASMMWEDVLMQCVFFGSPVLFESNKPGIGRYFKERGYEDFLIHIPGYNSPGIPSTPDNKQTLAFLTEEYIETNIEKVFFKDLIDQWLEFDLAKTQKFDLVMGAGWTLVADMHKLARREVSELRDVNQYFRKYKIA